MGYVLYVRLCIGGVVGPFFFESSCDIWVSGILL